MATKRKNNLDEEFSESDRDRKKRKQRYPRKRDYAIKEKRRLESEQSQKHRLEEAKEKIAKHLEKFPDLESKEGKKQAEKYLAWVVESLAQKFSHLADDDIEYKMAVPSVKAGGQQRQKSHSSVRATHLPTLISVRNEEERSKERNKQAAYENLYTKVTGHFSYWQTLAQEYSLADLEDKGVSLFKDLTD